MASLICTGARLGDALVVDVALVADPGAALDDHVGGDHLVHGGVVRQGQLDDRVSRQAGWHLSKNLRMKENMILCKRLYATITWKGLGVYGDEDCVQVGAMIKLATFFPVP